MTRRNSNGVRPSYAEKPIESDSLSDGGDGEEEEITRCACERTDSFGSMIQCEECNVWQHMECMNVNPKRVPKRYYCERCRPTNHPYFRVRDRQNSASSQVSSPVGKNPPKKRNTMNSREAAQSYTELIMLSPDGVAVPTLPSTPESATRNTELDVSGSRRGSSTRSWSGSVPSKRGSKELKVTTEAIKIEPLSFSPVAISSSTDEPLLAHFLDAAPQAAIYSEPKVTEKLDEVVERRQEDAVSSSIPVKRRISDVDMAPPPENEAQRQKGGKKAKSDASRRSNAKSSRGSKSNQGKAQNGAVASNGTSQAPGTASGGLDTTPPIKVKYPSAKASLGETNKRVKLLSDYITRLQVSMATEDKVDLPTIPRRPKTSSLSFCEECHKLREAPNLSSFDNDRFSLQCIRCQETGHDTSKEETSLEMLDRLNRALIKFQDRFGGGYKR
ncbi:hypothetical protein BC832DRAFT_339616 [Gaertneriomyces semiglobifer]|nr:hypothetical protein BC832DRAFT_339616 [Gaertneriomyces semiglobifer]